MKIDESLFSSLPYRPEILREKNLYAIGHPDLVPILKKLAEEKDLDLPEKSRVIKEHPNLIVQTSLLTDDNFPWPRQVIKQFRWRGIQNYLASPLKKSKALKSYLAACHLLKHGLGTPMPLGAVEVRKWGFVQESFYITSLVESYIDLKKYRDTASRNHADMHEVIEFLAHFILRMHDNGLLHRDLNLSNFLLTGKPGAYRIYLVDLNRAIFMDNPPPRLRSLDLARLDLYEWQQSFFHHYCRDRFEPHLMLWIANLARLNRSSWRKVAVPTKNLRRRIGIK